MAVLKLKATGRKVTGLKFGESFVKEIVRKVTAHAKKHAQEPNFVEIDLDGKELGDDGLAKVLEAVLSMLSGDVGNATFCLEELNLSRNNLTTAVLPLLVPIIQASSFDLRSLDISSNDLCVLTQEHARLWEQFLDAFRSCRVMRRLDFSGNDMSKSLAMEVFTRVYFSHQPIDPNELVGLQPIDDSLSTPYELHGAKLIEKTNSLTLQSIADPMFDPTASAGSLSNGVILKRRAGLRSIPYIILRDVGMTDAGVLHLSYILESHFWPQYLMTTLKEGSHAAKIKEEDDATHAFGLIYVDNPKISTAGSRLLECAEQARVELADISEMSESIKDTFEDPVEFSLQMRKVSSSSLSSAFQARGPSIPTENGFKGQDDNYRLEMEHLRKKLQRTTIESVGVNGVQLWAAALRLMTVARAIFPPGVILPPTFVIAPTEEPPESPLHKEDVVELGGTDDSIFPPLPPIFQAFPHKTLRIVASSEAATTTSAASTASKPTRGKGLAPRGSPTKSEKSSTAKDSTTPATLPANNSNKGRNRSTTVTSSRSLLKYVFEHRSGTWPAGLLPYLWNRVLLQTASADGILSATQRNAVIRYASDRNTLKIELQSQGKADSHQLWGILDRMGCLAYEVDV